MSKLQYEGYHEEEFLPVKKGDTITLLKGMKYEQRGEAKVVKRKYTITVDHILPGSTKTEYRTEGRIQVPYSNPSIRWAGSGGYWCSMDINEYLNRSESCR